MDALAYLNFFTIAGCVFTALVFAVQVILYARLAKKNKSTRSDTISNLTEVAIMFQAMRSVLHDQKSLARDFNKSVEQKAGAIRQVLEEVVTAADNLAKAQARLAQQIDRAEKRANAIEKRLAVSESTSPPPTSEEPDSVLQILATPVESAPMTSLLEGWKSFDAPFDEVASEETFDVPQEVPEAPKDPERARAAFRALLSMSEESTEGGNGRRKAEALNARVHEYHEAGMSVPQIAHELGIGKGEVRLMLSLHEKPKAARDDG